MCTCWETDIETGNDSGGGRGRAVCAWEKQKTYKSRNTKHIWFLIGIPTQQPEKQAVESLYLIHHMLLLYNNIQNKQISYWSYHKLPKYKEQ